MSFITALKELFFPLNITCDLCNCEVFKGNNICDKCLKSMTFNNKNTCPICGRAYPFDGVCLQCKDNAPKFKRAMSALEYSGVSAKLIRRFKGGHPYLKYYFAKLLTPLVMSVECDYLIYVPMLKRDENIRGYNQSLILCKEISKLTNIPIAHFIEKIRQTGEQKELTKAEREDNLRGSMRVVKRKVCRKKTFIIIDDVLTTGSTANAVSSLLLGAGAKRVYVVTIASVTYDYSENINGRRVI